jgi:hypothetical protein
MRAAWVVIGVALVLASGCAQQDWIDRTLVTVEQKWCARRGTRAWYNSQSRC